MEEEEKEEERKERKNLFSTVPCPFNKKLLLLFCFTNKQSLFRAFGCRF